MKTKYYLLLFLIGSFFIQGCDDDDNKVVERNQLKLTASSTSTVLDESKADEIALTFSWNKATNLGPDYTFPTYLFQLDVADNEFESAIEPIKLGEDGSYSFTHRQLYDLIIEKWRGTAGQPIQLEARVAAQVDGPKYQYPEIAYAQVEVTTYVPDSQPLYLLGTATEAGLDPEKAIKMLEVSNGKIYTWNGRLEAGNFKFITTLGSMLPSYNKGEDAYSLVERNDESQPDTYFEIHEAGKWNIYLSKSDMSISYKRVLYESLFLVGDGCAAGWELSKLLSMTADEVNPNIFTWQGALTEGELKILTEPEWNKPTFRPLTENASIESDELQLTQSDNPDHKWKITAEQAGLYKITIDTENMNIKFVKQD